MLFFIKKYTSYFYECLNFLFGKNPSANGSTSFPWKLKNKEKEELLLEEIQSTNPKQSSDAWNSAIVERLV